MCRLRMHVLHGAGHVSAGEILISMTKETRPIAKTPTDFEANDHPSSTVSVLEAALATHG